MWAVWNWCIRTAPASWPTQLICYDESFDQPVQLRRSPERSERTQTWPDTLTMAEWHAEYSHSVAPFKQALGRFLEPVRNEETVRSSTWVNFSSQIDRLLLDSIALHPPDPAVARPLQEEFQRFSTVAEACSRRATRTARPSLALADPSLGQAAGAMERNGLQP